MAIEGEKLGEVFVEIKLSMGKLESDMKTLKDKLDKGTPKPKIDYDTTLGKKKISELQEMQTKLKATLEKKISLNADANSLDRTRSVLGDVQNKLRGVGTAGEEATGKLKTGFQSFIGTLASLYVIREVVGFIKDITLEAAQFEEVSSYFRGSAEDMRNFRKATQDTVSDMGLMKLSNQASDLGISLEQQPLLFVLAKRAAEAYGTDTASGFQMVTMATEGNIRGLRAVGVQKMVYNQIVKDLARAHGGLITEMDAETQKEIRMQAIIKATGVTMDEVNKSVKSHADRIETISTNWENLKVVLGKGLTPFFAGIMDGLNKAITGFETLIQKMAGVKTIAGGADRQTSYAESLSTLTPDLVNKERDRVLKQASDLRDKIADIKAKPGTIFGVPWTDEDAAKLKVYEAQLNSVNEQIAVINNTKLYLPKADKTDNKVGGLTPEAMEARAQKQKEQEAKRQQIVKSYYDNVTFLDANYWDYRNKAMADEAAKEKAALGNKFNVEVFYNGQKKKLVDDYVKFLNDKLKPVTGTDTYKFNSNGELEGFGSPTSDLTGLKTPSSMKMKNAGALPDALNPTKQLEDWKKQHSELAAIAQTIVQIDSTFASAIDDMLFKGKSFTQSFGDAFKGMGEMIISTLTEIAVKFAMLKAAEAIFGAASGGFGGFLISMLGGKIPAHTGGEFVGTNNGVMKLAAGGSFIVPQGYQHDSFPLMVETGERVSVTPASQVSNSSNGYSTKEIVSAIKAMNMNMISLGQKPIQIHLSSADPTLAVKNNIGIQNKLVRGGLKTDLVRTSV